MSDSNRPTHKVRTRFEPDRVIEVDDAELTDLRRAGLLIEDTADKPTRRADQKGA